MVSTRHGTDTMGKSTKAPLKGKRKMAAARAAGMVRHTRPGKMIKFPKRVRRNRVGGYGGTGTSQYTGKGAKLRFATVCREYSQKQRNKPGRVNRVKNAYCRAARGRKCGVCPYRKKGSRVRGHCRGKL